jgi:alcohol dehydrogenase
MPRAVAAATGIDAMTHAIESYVTKKRTAVSRMFSREAWSLLSSSFETTLDEPGNLQARGSMQWGAHLAGAAIENSMLGAAHAAANPISAHFQTTHGIAVGLMLPHVIRWNRDHVGTSYCDLVMAAGWGTSKLTAETAADLLAEGFTRLLTAASQPIFLDKAVSSPLTEETLQRLAEEAAQQWTGTFNPRTMNQESFLSLYRNALTNADR